MNEVITFLMAVAAFAFVAYPLLRSKPAAATDSGDTRLEELVSKRNTTYSMIKELEFDHKSGILTDEDYRELESRYKARAVGILRDIDDQSGAGTDVEAEMEHEIRRARHSKGADNLDAELERLVRQSRKKKPGAAPVATGPREETPVARGPFCGQCGARSEPGDHFCTHCGTKLTTRGEQ